jgi:hypothetical protein
MNFNESVKIAKALEDMDQWEAAAAAWDQAKKKSGDTDFQFMADACLLIAKAQEMDKEIPKRSPDILMRVNNKESIIEIKNPDKESEV